HQAGEHGVRQRLSGEGEPAQHHQAADGAGDGADEHELEQRPLHQAEPEGLDGVVGELLDHSSSSSTAWEPTSISSSSSPGGGSPKSSGRAKVWRSTSAVRAVLVGPWATPRRLRKSMLVEMRRASVRSCVETSSERPSRRSSSSRPTTTSAVVASTPFSGSARGSTPPPESSPPPSRPRRRAAPERPP